MLFSCSFIFLLCEVCWVYWLCGLMSFIDFGQLNVGRRDTVPVPGSGPRRHHMSLLTPPMLTCWPKVPEGPIEQNWTQPAAWSQATLSPTLIPRCPVDVRARINDHRCSPSSIRCAFLFATASWYRAKASHGSFFLRLTWLCWKPGAYLLLPGHRCPPPSLHLLFSPSLWAKSNNSPRSGGSARISLPFLSAARWGLHRKFRHKRIFDREENYKKINKTTPQESYFHSMWSDLRELANCQENNCKSLNPGGIKFYLTIILNSTCLFLNICQ